MADRGAGRAGEASRVEEFNRVEEFSRIFRAALDGHLTAVLPAGPAAHLRTYPPQAWRGESRPPALVVFTSGSTGAPKGVGLSAAALRASAQATERALAGPGRWMLCLPPDHIAGAQVILRSLSSGTLPYDARGPFSAERFAACAREFFAGDDAGLAGEEAGPAAGDAVGKTALAAAAPPAPKATAHYVSLVPTQLSRILEHPGAVAQAARFDAILIGGAALHPHTAAAAARAGLPIVRTYGMSETGGGCVYDGRPLPGVEVTIRPDGRIVLTGPVVADGYVEVTADTVAPRPDPAFFGPHHARSFATSDLGAWHAEDGACDGAAGNVSGAGSAGGPDTAGPVLQVLGRADDVFISGGVNVSPHAVERVLLGELAADGVDLLLVPIADPEWGHLGALLISGGSAGSQDGPGCAGEGGEPYYRKLAAELKRRIGGRLSAAQLPRWVIPVAQIPARGIGKPDRVRARRLAESRIAGGEPSARTAGRDTHEEEHGR